MEKIKNQKSKVIEGLHRKKEKKGKENLREEEKKIKRKKKRRKKKLVREKRFGSSGIHVPARSKVRAWERNTGYRRQTHSHIQVGGLSPKRRRPLEGGGSAAIARCEMMITNNT